MIDFMQAQQNVLSILKVLKYNKKAFTANTLAKAANVDSSFTTKFLAALEEIKFLRLIKSPSGRLINYRLNPYSTEIYYVDISCIIKKGYTAQGRYNSVRTIYTNNDYKRALVDLPDEAKNAGVLLIRSELKPEMLAEELLKVMGLTQPTEVVDALAPYPMVKAQLEKHLAEQQRLQSEIDKEEKTNLDNKKWFEEETYKARTGKRVKPEYHRTGIITGYTTISKKVRVSYFFDDYHDQYEYERIPEYETRVRMVADYPTEREYSYEKKYTNTNLIRDIGYKIETLQSYPMKYEKIFKDEAEKQAQIAMLKKKKAELDAEIRRLNYR